MIGRRELLTGGAAAVVGGVTASFVRGSASGSACATTPSPRNRPPQPAALVWEGSGSAHLAEYARPGGLVCVGRDNFGERFGRDLAAHGATVVIYLDAVIDNAYGRYHELLLSDSELGPAVRLWPGEPRANRYGNLTDFRPGSVLQRKFGPVLERIVRENPHIGGVFLDDLGTRSWFPGVDYAAMPSDDRAAYRAGAVELVRTAREAADRHGLVLFVNGTWNAGDGGGYPDAETHGCSLVDGGVIENHGIDEIPFFAEYSASSQWGSATPRGIGYMWTINDGDPATRAAYVAAGVAAYATSQSDRDLADAPWSPIRDFGLPRSGCRGHAQPDA